MRQTNLLIAISVLTFSTVSRADVCGDELLKNSSRIIVCASKETAEIKYCRKIEKTNYNCEWADIDDGLKLFDQVTKDPDQERLESFVQHEWSSHIRFLDSKTRMKLASLINVLGVSSLKLGQAFENPSFEIEAQQDSWLSALLGYTQMTVPTGLFRISPITERLTPALEAVFALKKTVPAIEANYTRVNVCLDKLPTHLSGDEIKTRILSSRPKLQEWLRLAKRSVDAIEFCDVAAFDEGKKVLRVNIARPY